MSRIKRVHLIYPVGNKISTPDAIGRNIKQYLEKFYEVITYNYDEYRTIHPGEADVLIGHWHPNPFTVFRMSAKIKGWKRVIVIAPFCPDPTGWHNAFGNKVIDKCDRYLAITGNAWMKRLKDSPFQHWEPTIVHLDLAVDRVDFPFIKNNFKPAGKRSFLYIGHTAWCKNTSFLENLAEKLPEIDFAWMGGAQRLKNIKGFGKLDFSKVDAHDLIKEFDFLITVGTSDANPTTILEAMAWGLIPVCSIQSGYEGFSGIRNISIDNVEVAVETINNLQSISEEKLRKWQQVNLAELENHFNWDRFCKQVSAEIESKDSPGLAIPSLKTRLFLLFAEWKSPNFWAKPNNLYRFLKTNLKYVLQNQG
ncbi:MAG: hypothetical protein H8E38_00090 [SAR324 cluster bacterium]|nr:hypothetical protein [SAR324 cluster bacterium]MBL7035781.1 hypothetical protein [SAR324 cluster bacterium]